MYGLHQYLPQAQQQLVPLLLKSSQMTSEPNWHEMVTRVRNTPWNIFFSILPLYFDKTSVENSSNGLIFRGEKGQKIDPFSVKKNGKIIIFLEKNGCLQVLLIPSSLQYLQYFKSTLKQEYPSHGLESLFYCDFLWFTVINYLKGRIDIKSWQRPKKRAKSQKNESKIRAIFPKRTIKRACPF